MRILITGATGQVGSHLLWRLWRGGHEVTALVRPESAGRWRYLLPRIEQIFGPVPCSARGPIAVSGDLRLANAGVLSPWIAAHRGRIDAVIHTAADTRFHPVRREDQWQTNVQGTAHALALTETLGAQRVVHVSSLFVAGSGGHTLSETELEVGQAFRCPYERSKFEAERLAQAWAARTGISVTVARPGIVLGTSGTGTTLTYPHFFGFLRAIDLFAQRALPGESIAVDLPPHARPPLVCVDDVARAIEAALDAPLPPPCLHLFDPQSPTLEEIAELLRGDAAECVLHFGPQTDASPAARAVLSWLRQHRAFLAAPPQAENEMTCAWLASRGVPPPRVTAATLATQRAAWHRESQRLVTGAAA
ncbi:MAG: SDR family oxidoreductase [Candidatus Sumerlaeia bacterium]|nr:SDR family oxidoreductase [Candidatus Sumerlaeia bacterium]